MVKCNEVILQNTTLENVMRYLHEKLKGVSGIIEEQELDGTLVQHNIQTVFPWRPDKIKVEYTDVVIPKGDIQKAHGYWGNYVAISYEGMQLQINTVRIKAECHHPFILPIFDRYWADMLKDFGAVQPANQSTKNSAIQLETEEDGEEVGKNVEARITKSGNKLPGEIMQLEGVADNPTLQHALKLYIFYPEKTLAVIAEETKYKNQKSLATLLSAIRKELIKQYGEQGQKELLPNRKLNSSWRKRKAH